MLQSDEGHVTWLLIRNKKKWNFAIAITLWPFRFLWKWMKNHANESQEVKIFLEQMFCINLWICSVQDGLWWDWLTKNWSEWASCRKRRGSTSCNRFCSFGCGRKSEPSSFSRKVEISAFPPLKRAHGVLTRASNQQLFRALSHAGAAALTGKDYSQHASW